MRFMLDEGATLPTRAHVFDAGLDLYSRETVHIPARGYGIFDTGVHVDIPAGYAGLLKSKSGLNVKHHLTGEGVIDCGYTGSIVVKLYNHSDEPYTVAKGDKVIQLVVVPCELSTPEIVDSFKRTSRGDKGFGSSGK